MSLTDTVFGPTSNSLGYIFLGLFYGCFHIRPLGQMGGNGRRKGATGTMVITSINSFVGQSDNPIIFREIQNIIAILRVTMPALD